MINEIFVAFSLTLKLYFRFIFGYILLAFVSLSRKLSSKQRFRMRSEASLLYFAIIQS